MSKAAEVRAKAKAQLQAQVAARTTAAMNVVESFERVERAKAETEAAASAFEAAVAKALEVMTSRELQSLTEMTDTQLRPRRARSGRRASSQVVDLSTTGAGQEIV